MSASLQQLITKVQSYLSSDSVTMIEKAYHYAAASHTGQARLSGEPYIEHPLQSAYFLADLNLDEATIAATLLHDVIEDCGVTFDDIKNNFGSDVAKLVDSVTKLTRLDLPLSNNDLSKHAKAIYEARLQAESLRKMLVAMADDVRVILIKLADRLHNLTTLEFLPPRRRKLISQETLDIYAPLAHRLGIWDIKWRLEDMSFRYLEPKRYRTISKMLSMKRREREEYIDRVTFTLENELVSKNIDHQILGRPKNIYSIARKMSRYAIEGKDIGHIFDLYALRIIVDSTADCYNVLGVAHGLWHPIPGQFDDYIANPKTNMYQSLHTTVMCDGGTPLEIQIRTKEMHQIADYGVAAHWLYKGGGKIAGRFEANLAWLQQVLEWQNKVSGTDEFLESVRNDLFKDQVFVYTPKGDIVELPSSATPIDFAYKIHTELGHCCIGSKVNGKLVTLDYQLSTGDTIEILTTKTADGPSLDWLNPDLNFAKTATARSAIRQWFRRQKRSTHVPRGRDLIRKELNRLNISYTESEVASMFKFENTSEFLALIGLGSITESELASKISDHHTKKGHKSDQTSIWAPSNGVKIIGVGELPTRIGRCCGPLPGEEISGVITRNRGVTVHKVTCENIRSEGEPNRVLTVHWGSNENLYPVRVTISSWNRVGLLRDVTTEVSSQGVNIAEVITGEYNEGMSSISLTLHTTGIAQLSRLFTKLEGIRGVNSVSRSVTQTPASSTIGG